MANLECLNIKAQHDNPDVNQVNRFVTHDERIDHDERINRDEAEADFSGFIQIKKKSTFGKWSTIMVSKRDYPYHTGPVFDFVWTGSMYEYVRRKDNKVTSKRTTKVTSDRTIKRVRV